MAITISGENNNDRILAQDGVIDQISGINIVGLITASHINVGNNIQLGNYNHTSFGGYMIGNIGPCQIYNRALSASEVLHNYNALKDRFN